MKIQKVLSIVSAGVLTAAMTLSMSTGVFAAIGGNTSGVGEVIDGNYVIDLVAAGIDQETVTGFDMTFTVDDSEGFGGGIMCNGTKNGWHQDDANWSWGDPSAEKGIVAQGSDGTYTVSFTVPDGEFGPATDEDFYAQLFVQQWWGQPITITSVNIKTAGGDTAAAPAADAAADTAADGGEAKVAKTADMAPTAGILLAVAACGVIVVALKKRNTI